MSILPRNQAIHTQLYKKADAPVLLEFDSILCVDDDIIYAYHSVGETGVLVLLYAKTMHLDEYVPSILRILPPLARLYIYIPSRAYAVLPGFECMQHKTTKTVLGQSLHVEMTEWKRAF